MWNETLLALAAGAASATTSETPAAIPTEEARATSRTSSTFWWGDRDADGMYDAVVTHPLRALRLLANRGAAGFEDATAAAGLSGIGGVERVEWRDYDGDGRQDLLLVAPTGTSHLLRNDAAAGFVPVDAALGIELGAGVRDARWIDVDADGKTELLVVSERGETLFRNLGGRFEPTAVLAPRASSGADALDGAAGGSVEEVGMLSVECTKAVGDFSFPGTCIPASSIPVLGMLFPISAEWFVDGNNGRVGIGTTTPTQRLDVNGMIRTRSGGVMFPDGSMQTTATLTGPPGPQGPQGATGPQGPQGPEGPAGDSHWQINDANTFFTGGNVGIGTSSPTHRLHVTLASSNNAIFGQNSNAGAGVFGHQTATTGIRDGVGGRSDSIAGRGVFGWATSSTGNAYGVFGQSDSQTGRAIYGRTSAGAGTNYAIYGETNSASGFGGYFVGPVGSQNYFQRSVGIGTTDPASALSVAGGADLTGQVSIGITGADARLLVRSTLGEDAFRVRVETATKLLVKDNGGVGIGANFGTVPTDGLRVAGSVGIGADPGAFTLAVNGDAAKPGGGLWSVFSDARLKRDIEPLEAGTLERLLAIRGYTFEYAEEAIANRVALPGRQTGLIAQEVREVFPGWVDTDDEGYLYVTERGLTAIVVEALRELRAEKDAELGALRDENALLWQRLEQLEARFEER